MAGSAIPIPPQVTPDSAAEIMQQAGAQARAQLRADNPNIQFGPMPQSNTLQIKAKLSGIPTDEAQPDTPPPEWEDSAAPDLPPAHFEEPKTPAPPSWKGFWQEAATKFAQGVNEAAQGAGHIGAGLIARPLYASGNAKAADFADSLFKSVDDTFGTSVKYLQDRAARQEQIGNVGSAAQTVGEAIRGIAPIALGPEGFLGSTTMNAATNSLDQNQDIKTAYKLAGASLLLNGVGMGLPMKSPSLIKRMAIGAGGNLALSPASELLTKEILKSDGYREAADKINPFDPATLVSAGVLGLVFGALAKPDVANKFVKKGGKLPTADTDIQPIPDPNAAPPDEPPPGAPPQATNTPSASATPAQDALKAFLEKSQAEGAAIPAGSALANHLDLLIANANAEAVSHGTADSQGRTPLVTGGDIVKPAQAGRAGTPDSGASPPAPDGFVDSAPVAPEAAAPTTATVVPDKPSAEPVKDLLAQFVDMRDKKTPRTGVYLSKETLQSLKGASSKDAAAVKRLAGNSIMEDRTVRVNDGHLIFDTPENAKAAQAALDAGKDPQMVIGEATGAGEGKNPSQTAVVQGQTPEGAVAAETMVTPAEVPAISESMAAQGKKPVVTTPEAALARRTAEVAKDQGPVIGMYRPEKGAEVPIEIHGEENGVTKIKHLGDDGEPTGDIVEVPSERVTSSTLGEKPEIAPDEPSKPEMVGDVEVRDGTPPESPAKPVETPAKEPAKSEPVTAKEPVKPEPEVTKEPAKEAAKSEPVPASELKGDQQLKSALTFYEDAERPASGRKFGAKLAERQDNASAFARVLLDAATKAAGKAPDEVVNRALKAAKRAERLSEKTPEETAKNRGTGHDMLDKVSHDMRSAARELLGGEALPEKATTRREQLREARKERAAKREPEKVEEPPPKASELKPVSERETIDVAPRVMKGNEIVSFVRDEMGLDPEAISKAAEANGNKRGALADYLSELMGGLDINKGWIARLSALSPRSKSSPLNRGQHIKLSNLIKRFVDAAPSEVESARKEIIDFSHDINGKKLDDKTVEAIVRYAETRKKLADLHEKAFGDEEDSGPGKAEWEDTPDPEAVDHNPDSDEAADGYEHRDLSPSSLDVTNTAIAKVAAKLAKSTVRGVPFMTWAQGSLGKFFSSKKLFESVRTVAAMAGKDGEQIVRILDALIAHAPDLPVKFTEAVIDPRTGEPMGDTTAGLFDPRTHTLQVRISGGASPIKFLHAFLHEAVHGATVYELTNHPRGKLASRINELRHEAKTLLDHKYGRGYAENVEAFFEDRNSPELPNGFRPAGHHYGFSNSLEFVAEAMTNPKFQAELHDLDTNVRRRYVDSDPTHPLYGARDLSKNSSFVSRITEAIANFFGFKHPEDSGLLSDILTTSHEVMERQAANRGAPDASAGELVAALEQRRSKLIDAHDAPHLRALEDLETPPPRLRDEGKLREAAGDTATTVARLFHRAVKSGAWESARRVFNPLSSNDQLIRRNLRNFGHPDDPTNPVRKWDEAESAGVSKMTGIVNRARAIGEDWLRLPSDENNKLGQVMVDATTHGIDPTKAKDLQAQKAAKATGFDQRYDDIKRRFDALSPDAQSVFEQARDHNAWAASQSHKAGVDMALTGFDLKQVTPAQRALLYRAKSPYEIEGLVGDGKLVDVGESNDKLRKTLTDFAGLQQIDGPYFHLGRTGNKVVQVTPEGNKIFDTEREAQAFASRVRDLSPGSKAHVIAQGGGKYGVDYNAEYVSFHKSAGEAEAEAQRMRGMGFDVPAVTERTFTKENAPLSAGLRDLAAEINRKISRNGADEASDALQESLRQSFLQLIASRSSYASSRLARRGVGGVKADEMRQNFASHASSVAYHVSNLGSILAKADALAKIREAARDPAVGNASQKTMYKRGAFVDEVNRRLRQETQLYGHGNLLDSTMAKIGFMNYMASASHALVNLTQNFTTGYPVAGARWGYGKAAVAFSKTMSAALPSALRSTTRAMLSRPGGMTGTDITNAILEAVRQHPELKKWATGANSPLQQLLDRGVINTSFSNELAAIARGDSPTAAKAMEYARLMPHMADAYNRITTALAGLELTNGDVRKAADFTREVHIDYSTTNRPRAFKRIGSVPGLSSVTMFKSYVQGMAHLLYSNIKDAVVGGSPGGRAEAAKIAAGMMLGTSIFGGVIKGAALEPIRLAVYAYNKMFGDDDEYHDMDNSIRHFLSDHFGQTGGDAIANGAPHLLGIDLSSRLGLSDLVFHDPPDLLASDKAKVMEFLGTQLGPIPQFFANAKDGFMRNMEKGDVYQALSSLIPVKAFHELEKSIQLYTGGKTNQAGGILLKPEEVSPWAAIVQGVGLKPTAIAKIQERQNTAFSYGDWARSSKTSLVNQYWNAKDPASKEAALQAVRDFNEKNPGQAVRRSDLLRIPRSALKGEQVARGEPMRDPTLQKLVNY